MDQIQENISPKKRWNFQKLITKRNLKIFAGLLIAFFVLFPLFTYVYFARDLTDKQSIMNRNNAGVTLLDDKGEVFFTFYSPKELDPVALGDISENVQNAVIASEDRDFYTNPGFSPRGIARAFITNLNARQIREGGSTISQQLVKNALLSSDRTFLRKYQELILALEIERRYSKEDILEMYLNSVYFGEGEFGIENAAQKYFAKDASQLNLTESTLLVAILPAPSALSPFSGDLESAKERQEIVLSQMIEAGFITEAEKDVALSQKLNFAQILPDETNTIAPHFALMVKDFLIREYGEETITRSGFRVKTTLNKNWQEFSQTTVQNQVRNLTRNKVSNGAAVVMDPKTGQIKALVGSADWENEDNGKLNITIANRQPGSAFKPIVYAKALEDKDVTAATTIDDTKTSWGNYTPKNFDNKFRGQVTVRRALANSLNIPSVKVMEKVGVEDTLEIAEELGISTLGDDTIDYGLSLVLGAGDVKLLELTAAFGAFADSGTYHEPNFITEINDKKENTIYTYEEEEKRVLNDGVAFIISSILSDNNARREVFGNSLTVSRQAAVKTGTTENFRDALTVGYTPNLVVGVWVGNNDGAPMDSVAGSLGAAPIWRALMNKFLAELPNERFSPPSSVVERNICTRQIAQPSPDPSASPAPSAPTLTTQKEYFLRGTEPEECKAPSPTPTASPSSTPTPSPEQTPSPTPTLTPIPTPQNNESGSANDGLDLNLPD